MVKVLPLAGKRIAVTRNIESASELTRALEAQGAEVLELPLIEIRPALDQAAAVDVWTEIAQYEWLIFTSANGVRHFFEFFFKAFEDIRALGLLRIAAVGEGTARAVRSLHLKVDLTPGKATAEALAEALKQEQTLDNLRVLIVTGSRNREDLAAQLEKAQAIVDKLQVYETVFPDIATHPSAKRFREEGADALIFASSSAVQSFGEQAQHLKLVAKARVPALCSFGPQTSATMKARKIPVAVEAENPGIDSMVEGLVAYFNSPPARSPGRAAK